jgi:hypothetical protein
MRKKHTGKSKSAESATARFKSKEPALTRGADGVFEDLGFPPEEAGNLKIRADLLLDLRRYIAARGYGRGLKPRNRGQRERGTRALLR